MSLLGGKLQKRKISLPTKLLFLSINSDYAAFPFENYSCLPKKNFRLICRLHKALIIQTNLPYLLLLPATCHVHLVTYSTQISMLLPTCALHILFSLPPMFFPLLFASGATPVGKLDLLVVPSLATPGKGLLLPLCHLRGRCTSTFTVALNILPRELLLYQ